MLCVRCVNMCKDIGLKRPKHMRAYHQEEGGRRMQQVNRGGYEMTTRKSCLHGRCVLCGQGKVCEHMMTPAGW
jgi:hypothetical protein